MLVVAPAIGVGGGVVLAGAGLGGAMSLWSCDQSDNGFFIPSLDLDSSCVATEIALARRVAVACGWGGLEGSTSTVAHMTFVEEDQAFDASDALVGAGIGCATGGVLEGSFGRFFRQADDVAPNRVIACANSVPTGTLVLMADGSHRAIDLIEPGDQVVAYDTDSGEWNERTVLDQWSHVDTGDMVTVNLVDGSSVSATDHHEFWVSGDNQWVYAEDLEPGDLLVDPDGPAEVADVTYWPDGDNLVWELTVDEDHTFTVHTGTTDVVVHNADVCDFGPSFPSPTSGRHIRNNLSAPTPSIQFRVNASLSDALSREGAENIGVQVHHIVPQQLFRSSFVPRNADEAELVAKLTRSGFDVHDFRNTVALPTRTDFTGPGRDRLDELAFFGLERWPDSARHLGGHSGAYFDQVVERLNGQLNEAPTPAEVASAISNLTEDILTGDLLLYLT